MVRIVDRKTLKKKLDAKEAFVLLDARSRQSYEEEHIAGAISVPVDEAEKKAGKIIPDKKKEIITSCGSFECPASTILAEKLIRMGYKKVSDYKGGIKEWKEAGYPTKRGG